MIKSIWTLVCKNMAEDIHILQAAIVKVHKCFIKMSEEQESLLKKSLENEKQLLSFSK